MWKNGRARSLIKFHPNYQNLRSYSVTALTAAMRYIPKSESFDRRGQGKKLYCIIAGSAVLLPSFVRSIVR